MAADALCVCHMSSGFEFTELHDRHGPGWRGPVQILSTVPTVDWVLLGSGESIKGWDCGSL